MVKLDNVISVSLMPADASFTDEELWQLKSKAMQELRLLYPKLANVKLFTIKTRFQIQDNLLKMVVDFVSLPQGSLAFGKGKNKSADWNVKLEDIASMVLGSAQDAQARIYQHAQQANTGLLGPEDRKTMEDISFAALLRRHRNATVLINTSSGQDRFDFPEIIKSSVVESPVVISGLVVSVGREWFEVGAVKIQNHAEVCYVPPAYSHKKKVLYPSREHDPLEIGTRMLAASIGRQRVSFSGFVAIRPLTCKVDHFILDSPTVEVIGCS